VELASNGLDVTHHQEELAISHGPSAVAPWVRMVEKSPHIGRFASQECDDILIKRKS
jgi:hypothetical protein